MNRRGFLGLTAAFAAAGCTTTETKKVDAVTRATPVVPWKPFPNAKKVRVVQWGMCHEHADGKFKSVKKLPDDYELVGIIDDRASKTPREDRDFKVFDGVPRMTPTSMRVSHLRGLKRLMEPKEMTSPRGSAPARVTKNRRSVCPKPSFSDRNTTGICSAICRSSSCMKTQPLSRNRGNRREAVSPQDEPMITFAR